MLLYGALWALFESLVCFFLRFNCHWPLLGKIFTLLKRLFGRAYLLLGAFYSNRGISLNLRSRGLAIRKLLNVEGYNMFQKTALASETLHSYHVAAK